METDVIYVSMEKECVWMCACALCVYRNVLNIFAFIYAVYLFGHTCIYKYIHTYWTPIGRVRNSKQND